MRAAEFDKFQDLADKILDDIQKEYSYISTDEFVMPKIRLTNEYRELVTGSGQTADIIKYKSRCDKKMDAVHKETHNDQEKEALEHIDELYKLLEYTIRCLSNQEEKEVPYFQLMREVEQRAVEMDRLMGSYDRQAVSRQIVSVWKEVQSLIDRVIQRENALPLFGTFEKDLQGGTSGSPETYAVITLYIQTIADYAQKHGLEEDALADTVLTAELFHAVHYYNIPSKFLGKRKHWDAKGKAELDSETVKNALAQAFACQYLHFSGETREKKEAFRKISEDMIRNWSAHDFPNYAASGALVLCPGFAGGLRMDARRLAAILGSGEYSTQKEAEEQENAKPASDGVSAEEKTPEDGKTVSGSVSAAEKAHEDVKSAESGEEKEKTPSAAAADAAKGSQNEAKLPDAVQNTEKTARTENAVRADEEQREDAEPRNVNTEMTAVLDAEKDAVDTTDRKAEDYDYYRGVMEDVYTASLEDWGKAYQILYDAYIQ